MIIALLALSHGWYLAAGIAAQGAIQGWLGAIITMRCHEPKRAVPAPGLAPCLWCDPGLGHNRGSRSRVHVVRRPGLREQISSAHAPVDATNLTRIWKILVQVLKVPGLLL